MNTNNLRKIRTFRVYPPFPDRSSDWQAVFDDDDGDGPVGWGRTEQEAIDALMAEADA